MKDMLTVSSSPHLKHPDTTSGIMLDVIIALAPAAIYGCILFGIRALLLIFTCIISAVLAEYIWCKLLKKPISIGDLSAVVTGLLLAMNLSSAVPICIAAIGSAVAIIVVKQMFGGLGFNFANPAITARIVLLVSFPSYMAEFLEPVMYDAVTSATPLVREAGAYTFNELFFGMHGGCIGETSAFLLIVGGLYLILRRVINPIIPVCFIGTVALFSLIFGENVIQQVFGGGLILGAIFMATDYTTSPTTNKGKLIFGIGCGLLTFVIRRFASLPEGVSSSILLMNILVPYINKATLTKPFGVRK
ncbi:MAG: RnfABCDGE type electron transport complex subunit D [Clostridia bacterium]|nr:RnfABCDGE type electron transport complex subunit D [Clostridia bacterium]